MALNKRTKNDFYLLYEQQQQPYDGHVIESAAKHQQKAAHEEKS